MAAPNVEDVLHELMRALLPRCDMLEAGAAFAHLILEHDVDPELIERIMTEELAVLAGNHDVQRYWLGQCNCHGELN